MEQIKEAAREKFTEAEIDDFINMGTKITSKAVLAGVCEVLRASTHANAVRLIERLEKLMPAAAGVIEIELAGLDMKLNIALTLCPVDYAADIPVPDDAGFKKDLYTQYDMIKQLAVAYWKQFATDYEGLVTQLKECCPGANFNELTIGKTSTDNTTLYFDITCAKRIGVFPYYTDMNGLPYVKKNNGRPVAKLGKYNRK